MPEIIWQAPEFEYREKSVSWYWLSIIIAVIILGIAVWQRNFLFGFFVVVAEVLVLSWANREPRMVEFRLDEKNLTISGRKHYPLSEFESFSADENGSDWQNIHLQFKNRLKPRIRIFAPKEKYAQIQSILGARLAQLNHEPSLLDTLEKFIGF